MFDSMYRAASEKARISDYLINSPTTESAVALCYFSFAWKMSEAKFVPGDHAAEIYRKKLRPFK